MSDNSKTNIISQSIERGANSLRSLLFRGFNLFYTKAFWGLLQHVDRKFVKFLFVGAINTIFGYTTYAIFVSFSIAPSTALLLSYILSIFWNFKTTGSIVFKNSDNKLIFKFFLSYVFTYWVNNTGLNFLMRYTNKYIAEAIVILPVAVLSFCIFKFLIFKEKKN